MSQCGFVLLITVVGAFPAPWSTCAGCRIMHSDTNVQLSVRARAQTLHPPNPCPTSRHPQRHQLWPKPSRSKNSSNHHAPQPLARVQIDSSMLQPQRSHALSSAMPNDPRNRAAIHSFSVGGTCQSGQPRFVTVVLDTGTTGLNPLFRSPLRSFLVRPEAIEAPLPGISADVLKDFFFPGTGIWKGGGCQATGQIS